MERAAHGLTALAGARERPPTLIVLGVYLSDLDSSDVTQCSRRKSASVRECESRVGNELRLALTWSRSGRLRNPPPRANQALSQ